MSKIVFFSIPAHGHTNPTIPVVAELVNMGHDVWYYSFKDFKEKIENAGANFIACDEFLPQTSEDEIAKKAGKDFAALIEMVADTTLAMEGKVLNELKQIQPDCIVSDSLCFWGKLFAQKLNLSYICSTTSFAFNQHTAKLMKRSVKEIFKMILGMSRINKKIKLLNERGYEIKSFVSLIENDNETDTIVYTSKEFQPMAESFSDKYHFVGPSIPEIVHTPEKSSKLIYISLGTVLNQNDDFYQNCLRAFANRDYDVVMSVGDKTDIPLLGGIPTNFTIKNRVNQIEILQKADVFITHCGMNSVNESLYFGVPMVLFPQHSEQMLVADRASELGTGIKLRNSRPDDLEKAVNTVLKNSAYQNKAKEIAETFRNAGGSSKAARVILDKINAQK